jgi:N-acetylglucosamine-6-phosphate deacetylase
MKTIRFSDSRVVREGGIGPLGTISIERGLITAFEGDGGAGGADYHGLTVVPGFIDVHNHGAVGVDVNAADTVGLMKVAAFLAKQGVTSWIPTLVPDSDENYQRSIDSINDLMLRQQGMPVAQAVGVHYEGVFANHAMCGALRKQYFKTPASGARLPTLDSGVHMTTLAPEIEGAVDRIKELTANGWVVSIGHTAADRETLDAAFDAGARHMTHFFNAMTGIHHRDLGVAGWGLAKSEVTFDIIADGIHVAPEMLRIAIESKTPLKVLLISDSVAPTGLGDGDFELWGERVSVAKGKTQNERGSIAGSVCTMLDCVTNARSIGFGDVEIAAMSSANPARLLGLSDRGSIATDLRADLVGLSTDGTVAFTMIGGDVVPVP